MTLFLRLLLVTLFSSFSLCFCFSQDITLNSQADVDAFDTSITEIDGNFRIETTDTNDPIVDLTNLLGVNSVVGDLDIRNNATLTNINGLSNLISIGGYLEIYDNDALIHIDGLSSLTSLGGFLKLTSNLILINIDGLSNLTSIEGFLEITGNYALINIDGLSNITSIGEYSAIFFNDALTNIDGLSNITSVEGYLFVYKNDALTNLDGLSNLTSVEERLEIRSNYALTNIDGLSNLTSIGGFLYIEHNDVLTNIDGLSNLTSVGEHLWIGLNDALTNVDGFSNLTFVGDYLDIWGNDAITNIDGLSSITSVGGKMQIGRNPVLTNIDGLSNLTSVGGFLKIDDNDILTNIDGLSNLTSVEGYLQISENPALTSCCAIQELLLLPNAIGGSIDIHDNPSECSSFIQIIEECATLAFSGFFFYDQNENGIKDPTEYGLNLQSISTQPDNIFNYSSSNGEYRVIAENGTYIITPNIPAGWYLTSDSTSYTVTLIDQPIENLNFGFKPFEEVNEITPDLTSAATRCGFTVPFWLNYQNTGTVISTGNITLELDPLTTYISANPEPAMIDGNILTWNYADLPPTYNNQIDLQLEMPGVDNLGDTLHFYTTATVLDMDGNEVITGSSEYHSVVNCAYDPNDKRVSPQGIEEAQYTLFGQTLEYTVRFQNTGTDTAFTVRVTDQLDENLDWTTFQPLHASHSFDVTLSENGLVEFLFENILLPDSTTNNIGSNGYFMYQIDLLADLPENTVVENTANIFFDFNPPIQTNTTLNTFVTEFPTSTREAKTTVDIQVFPNPFSDYTNIAVGALANEQKATLYIRDLLGRVIEQYPLNAHTIIQVGNGHLPTNLYFYELRGQETNALLGSGKLVKH